MRRLPSGSTPKSVTAAMFVYTPTNPGWGAAATAAKKSAAKPASEPAVKTAPWSASASPSTTTSTRDANGGARRRPVSRYREAAGPGSKRLDPGTCSLPACDLEQGTSMSPMRLGVSGRDRKRASVEAQSGLPDAAYPPAIGAL